MSKKTTKIICIVLAALMALSALAVLFQTFAAEPTSTYTVVDTGENKMDVLLPIIVIAVAVVVILLILILPALIKKRKK